MFLVLFFYILENFSEALLEQLFDKSDITIPKQFCLKDQKHVETCISCVLKVQPLFLNLSSKGYLISELEIQIFNGMAICVEVFGYNPKLLNKSNPIFE